MLTVREQNNYCKCGQLKTVKHVFKECSKSVPFAYCETRLTEKCFP